MALTRFERKARLRHGDAIKVAAECKCSQAYVSEVLADKAGEGPVARKVQVALARKMKLRVAQAFGNEPIEDAAAEPTDPHSFARAS